MTTRQLRLKMNGPQLAAYNVCQPGNTVFLGWGRGVGKSKFLRMLWWLLIAQHDGRLRTEALSPFRGVRITILMPTLKQFKDVHWSGIVEDLTGEWAWLGAKLDKQTGQITFPGGSWIKPFPATEYNARTALGVRTDVLVIDECDTVPASVYDAVAVPWLSEPWSLALQLIAGTPNMGRHGLWWRTYQQGLQGEAIRTESPAAAAISPEDAVPLATVYSFRATYKDAPETVSARAVAKAKATTLPQTFKREWEADPDAGEGLIYPFDADFHVREPPPDFSFPELHIGCDWGDTDPAVLLKGGILGHGEDAALWLLDEQYEPGVPNDIWNARALAWGNDRTIFWPDPSRADRIRDFRGLGLNVHKSDNSIDAGIARVANLLFKREREDGSQWCRLYVSPRCVNTIREFGLYRWKKHYDGTFSNGPEDKNNHAMDSLRYMTLGRFGPNGSGKNVASGR